jgi:hypothetical protein
MICVNHPAVLLVALALCIGCQQPDEAGTGSPQSTATAATDSPPSVSEQELQALEALGYLAWDPDADESLRGVTRHDSARTAPGYNLYTNDVDEVYLQDLEGKHVHVWRLKGRRHCEYAELLDDGTLLVVCEGEALVHLGWNSDVLLYAKGPVHHDVAVVAGQSFLVPYSERVAEYRGRRVKFDGLAQISPKGRVERRWSTFKSLKMLQRHHHPSKLDTAPTDGEQSNRMKVYDYYHLNTVEVLPETPLGARDRRFRAGNLLICLRNANLIAILDQQDFSVTWHWGTDTLDLPHMPTMLDTGNILLFDNGESRGFSRVLEIDPSKETIVWTFESNPLHRFYSAWRGSVQRLPNGNTLICESERGHVFEVTQDGTIVWEFWNPEMQRGKRKRIYRFMRLAPERIERLLTD